MPLEKREYDGRDAWRRAMCIKRGWHGAMVDPAQVEYHHESNTSRRIVLVYSDHDPTLGSKNPGYCRLVDECILCGRFEGAVMCPYVDKEKHSHYFLCDCDLLHAAAASSSGSVPSTTPG